MGGIRTRSRLETNLSETACWLAVAGAGVSIVDPFTAAQFEPTELAALPFRPRIEFELFLIHSAFQPRSRLLNAFVAELKSEIARFAA